MEKSIDVPESMPVELEVEDKELSCDENTVVLEPTIISGNISEIIWNWSNGSDQSWTLAEGPGNYTLQIDDGCTVQEYTMHVNMSTELQDDNFFYIPNVFSPNNDGINDLFQVIPNPDQTILRFEFRIFDRWGNMLFGTTNTNDGWNGEFQGIQMQPDVYVWYIKAKVDQCGLREFDLIKKGDLTIVR
jgi:gliding motility-associated-like protein